MRDQQALMSLVLKSILQQQQKMRDIEGVVFSVFIAPEEDEVIKAATRQGRLYSKKVEEMGKGHGLGPPHLFVMSAIIKTITKELKGQVEGAEQNPSPEQKAAQDIFKQQATQMEAMAGQWSQLSLEEKNDIVPFVRAAKMYKTEQKKLIISMNSHTPMAADLRQLVVKHLRARPEWEAKTGRPPAGHMERELGAWLKLMMED